MNLSDSKIVTTTGTKLTPYDIEQISKNEPGTEIDNCFICDGNEVAGEMHEIVKGKFELICGDCLLQLEGLITVEVKEKINEVFLTAHEFLGAESGDITPCQKEELDELEHRMIRLIIEQARQNVSKPQIP